MLENGGNALRLVWQFPPSWWEGHRARDTLDGVHTFFMFIGYPRSGHSLVGSLLDAHPVIVCAYELGVLKYVLAGYGRRAIYYRLLKNSEAFTARGRATRYYSFQVPGQWQGTSEELRIIGDKQGDGAALRLKARPWLLDRLRRTVACRVRLLHVVRNPFDNISTISTMHRMRLEESAEYYFHLCCAVKEIKRHLADDEILELRHESFVGAPRKHLREICSFLGADAPEDYLEDCAAIVDSPPHRTRHHVNWSRSLIRSTQRMIEDYPPLHGYEFDD